MQTIKKLTDVRVAALNYTSERNLQQTYKNAKSSKNITYTEETIKMKKQQYDIMRLGATCVEYDIDEELLISAINFIKNIKI